MTVNRCATIGVVMLGATLQVTAQQQAVNQLPPGGGLTARAGGMRPLSVLRPDALSTIQGNALNSTNGQLPNMMVRLRDARFGRILDSHLTDESGLFTFNALDPCSYIVEMMGGDQSVLAASQVLNINAGEAASAVVKLPFRIPPFAGVLGNTTPTTAAAVTTEAAASSVLAVTTVGDPTCP